MNKKTASLTAHDLLNERLLTAQEVAYSLNLPLSYLIQPAKREALRIPHYHVNQLVRYKLSELQDWQARRSQEEGGRA